MEKVLLKSEDFLDGQNHSFTFGSVEIERSIRCLSVYVDWHYLELFGNWEVVGIYENEQAETPKKLLIKVHKLGVVEVDPSRPSKLISENVTEARIRFFASSEMIAEGEKTIKFGRIQVRYDNKTIRVTDWFLKAELYGSWEITSVYNKAKDDFRKIEINISVDRKNGAYLCLKR